MSYVYASWWLRLKKPILPGGEERDLTAIHIFDAERWPDRMVALCGRPIHWACRPAYGEARIMVCEPPIPVEKLCGRCLKIAGKKVVMRDER